MDNTIASLIQLLQACQEREKQKDEQLKKMQQTIDKLSAQIAYFQHRMFGKSSEKHGVILGPTLFDELSETNNIPEESLPELDPTQTISITTKKKHRTRKDFMEGLPVIQVILEPEGVDLTKYKRIGQESSKVIEFVPGKLHVVETIRYKYALIEEPKEGEKAVIIAPLPLSPINRAMAGSSLLTELLVGKYVYHLPFYRQIQQFKDLGIKLTASTINDWFIGSCDLLKPLYNKIKEAVLACNYLQVDETTLPVINKEKKQATKEYLWLARAVTEKILFFSYLDGSRSQHTAQQILQGFKGHLQCDGYNGYDVFQKDSHVHLVACWAHVRRKYIESTEENKELSGYALKHIQALYALEKTIRENNYPPDKIKQERAQIALPIINKLQTWIEETYPKVLPKSNIGKAMAYNYSLINRLKEYTTQGYLLIDNNLAENAIRPIALSRKNFLFCGNHNAAENAAIMFTIIGCCKEQGINTREYLNDILSKLPYFSNTKKDISHLLPWEWIKSNPAAKTESE